MSRVADDAKPKYTCIYASETPFSVPRLTAGWSAGRTGDSGAQCSNRQGPPAVRRLADPPADRRERQERGARGGA